MSTMIMMGAAVLTIFAIMAVIVAVILFVCFRNTEMTNRKVLHGYFGQMLSRLSFERQDSMLVTVKGSEIIPYEVWLSYDSGRLISKKEMLDVFADVLFQLTLAEMKQVKIEKSSLDIYNMWQNVDDIRLWTYTTQHVAGC